MFADITIRCNDRQPRETTGYHGKAGEEGIMRLRNKIKDRIFSFPAVENYMNVIGTV
jgi:hypothetical protein